MRTVFSAAGVRACDLNQLKNGVSESELIDRAAAGLFGKLRAYRGKRFLIAAGCGNNGADGLALALLLRKAGEDVTALVVGERPNAECEKRIAKLGGVCCRIEELSPPYDVVIDALLGIGLSKAPKKHFAAAIAYLNALTGVKIAVDIPSGIHADSGQKPGEAFRADLTLTMMGEKFGLLLGDGRDCAGKIRVIDIGIPNVAQDCGEELGIEILPEFFKKRKINTHKGSYGRVGIAGGSGRYLGSVRISCQGEAALRCGCGYCYLLTDENIIDVYDRVLPEAIVCKFSDRPRLDSLAIGMGMGDSEEARQAARALAFDYADCKLVLDADALAAIGAEGLPHGCIVTPHLKEFASLSGVPLDEVMADSVRLAKNFAKERGVVVVLKSATTVITDGERVYLNTFGSPALAKGGSGDLLSGIMAALLARCDDRLTCACAACVLMGLAAERAALRLGEHSVLSSDVAACVKEIAIEYK